MMINALLNRLVLIVLAVVVTACSSLSHKQNLSGSIKGQYRSEKVSVAKKTTSLSSDIIYNILVGEIALQRRDLGLAYKHQLKGADLAQDAVAAERATRIALHQQDQAGALVAIKRWIGLDPESPKARQIAVMLYIQSGNSDAALKHLRSLVKQSEKQGQDGFIQAIAAVSSGKDRPLALKLMRSLAANYSFNPGARYAVALTAVMARNLDVAESEIRQAIKIKPKMDRAHVLLGRIFMERKDAEGAMRAFQKALEISPDSTVLRSAYARILIDLNKPKLAYEQFQQLSRLSPDDADVKFSLGILSLQMERREQAAEHFHGLIKSGKRVVDAFYYLGRIAEMDSKPESAMDWYAKVDGGAYLFDAQARTAGLVADQGDLAKARAMLGGMRVRTPKRSVDLYILEGEILRKHSTNDKVVDLYNAALKENPEDLDLLYARALSASAQGRVDILERDILFILKQKPDHADALNALGYTLADKTDRHQEALDYIEKALAIKPESPAILDSMGWVQYRLGNHEEALQYLRRAFELLQDVEIAAHFGELLWVTGKKQEAQKILQGALKKNPDNKYLLQAIKRLGI